MEREGEREKERERKREREREWDNLALRQPKVRLTYRDTAYLKIVNKSKSHPLSS